MGARPAEVIPETHALLELDASQLVADRAGWVVKRAMGRVGDEVFVGTLFGDADWQALVPHARSLASKGEAWIAQRFVRSASSAHAVGRAPRDPRRVRRRRPLRGVLRAPVALQPRLPRRALRPRVYRREVDMRMMRRALALPPVLLASGCVSEATTPAVSVGAWATTPQVVDLRLPTRDDALRHWQLPPIDPWAPYAKYTLLTALDVVPEVAELPDPSKMEDVARAFAAGEQLGTYGFPPDVMFVVDMRGAASVAFGAGLSRTSRQPVSLVPTFNNWPGDDELVPAEETLAALATMWPADPQQSGPRADARPRCSCWTRGGSPTATRSRARPPTTTATSSPPVICRTGDPAGARDPPRRLRHREPRRHDARGGRHPRIAFLQWQYSGIPIAMVDVYRLEAPVVGEQWDELFAEDLLVVRPRRTILDEPRSSSWHAAGSVALYAHPSPLCMGAAGGGARRGWVNGAAFS